MIGIRASTISLVDVYRLILSVAEGSKGAVSIAAVYESLQLPDDPAIARILQDDSAIGKLLPDAIRRGEVSRLARRLPFGNQKLYFLIVGNDGGSRQSQRFQL